VLRTQVVLPNTPAQHGQAIQIGDVTFRMHHYGTAHTPWNPRKSRSKSKNTHRVGRVRIYVSNALGKRIMLLYLFAASPDSIKARVSNQQAPKPNWAGQPLPVFHLWPVEKPPQPRYLY